MDFLIIIPIGVFVIAFLFIASVAFSSRKKNKKTEKRSISVIEQHFNEHLRKIAEANKKPKEKVCEYCGSTVPNGMSECESCGAKVKK